MHEHVSQPQGAVAPQGQQSADEAQVDLRAVLRVLKRHRWLIVATVFVVVSVALLITFQLHPRFTATALVVADNRNSQMLGFEPGIANGLDASGLVGTEVEIARSSNVLERAAKTLELGQSPDFSKPRSFIDTLKSLVGMSDPAPADVANVKFSDLPDTEQVRLVEAFSKRVSVNRIGLTSVISVSATAGEPQTAAKMANAVANAYLTEQLSAKVESNDRALQASCASASMGWPGISARSKQRSTTSFPASYRSLDRLKQRRFWSSWTKKRSCGVHRPRRFPK